MSLCIRRRSCISEDLPIKMKMILYTIPTEKPHYRTVLKISNSYRLAYFRHYCIKISRAESRHSLAVAELAVPYIAAMLGIIISSEIDKFVEMCFDPKSPMSERLKAT